MSHRVFFFVAVAMLVTVATTVSAQERSVALLEAEPQASSQCRSLPSNITAGSAGRALVLAVARLSETFREQCALVARAPHLKVVIHVVGRVPSSTARATTEIRRNARHALTAIIQVPVSVDSAELLGHEFEHVVEQLHGVCLRTLVDQVDSGVTRTAGGGYETARAKAAGRRVAAEVAAARHHRHRSPAAVARLVPEGEASGAAAP